MRPVRRRALLLLGAAAAGGSVAGAWQLGKPAVHTAAAEPGVHLLSIDTMQRIEPPASLAAAELVDGEGGVHGIADFAGSGLVINLWATWCVPCVAELPALAVLAGRLKGFSIQVLALSSDKGGAAAVEAFYRQHGITGLPVWLDPKGAAAQAWGVEGIPTTFIVDRQGRERGRLEGPIDWASEGAVAAIRGVVG